jgi:carboxypeptidase Q
MTIRASLVLSALLSTSLAPVMLHAQSEPVDLDMVTRIRAEGLGGSSEVMDTLWHITDHLGPRLTNSPQQRAAAEWARDRLTEYGLENAAVEAWGEFGLGWSFERCVVEMTEPAYMPLIATPKAWTLGLDTPVSGQPVLVDVETVEDLEAFRGQLAGKIILNGGLATAETPFEPLAERHDEESLDELAGAPEPASPSGRSSRRAEYRAWRALSRKKSEFFKEEGVAVVVSPDAGRRNHYGVIMLGSGGSYDPEEERALPQITVSGEQYNRLARLIKHDVPVTMDVDVRTTFYDDDLQGYNVVAELPGTDLAHEVVMIGGHFDSWHPATGATDNGASCAVMIEALRILKAVGAQPRRTIRVALWTGEEQGLKGSKGYVLNHFGDSETMELKPEHETLAAYFNMDNGAGKLRGIYMEDNAAVRPIFDAWFKPFEDLGAGTTTMRGTGGTDHLSFQAVGLPGFQFIQDPMDYSSRTHHTNMDLLERVHESDVRQAATVIASFAYHAATRDEMLPRKPLPVVDPPEVEQVVEVEEATVEATVEAKVEAKGEE